MVLLGPRRPSRRLFCAGRVFVGPRVAWSAPTRVSFNNVVLSPSTGRYVGAGPAVHLTMRTALLLCLCECAHGPRKLAAVSNRFHTLVSDPDNSRDCSNLDKSIRSPNPHCFPPRAARSGWRLTIFHPRLSVPSRSEGVVKILQGVLFAWIPPRQSLHYDTHESRDLGVLSAGSSRAMLMRDDLAFQVMTLPHAPEATRRGDDPS